MEIGYSVPSVRWLIDCVACGKTVKRRLPAPCRADGTLLCPDCWVWESRQIEYRDRPMLCSFCGQVRRMRDFHRPKYASDGYGRKCAVCRAGKEPPICAHCGAEFTAKRQDARYCSPRCRTAAHRAKPS